MEKIFKDVDGKLYRTMKVIDDKETVVKEIIVGTLEKDDVIEVISRNSWAWLAYKGFDYATGINATGYIVGLFIDCPKVRNELQTMKKDKDLMKFLSCFKEINNEIRELKNNNRIECDR